MEIDILLDLLIILRRLDDVVKNEVSCGVGDFERVVKEYEVLTALPQTFDSYLNHVPYGMPAMMYLPPDVYPESMR